jgi:predicted nucleic acid-binding protein
MRFWDASALVPLVVLEKGSALVKGWLREDPSMILWGLSWLELASAVERRAREGLLTTSERVRILDRVERIASDAHEVSDLAAVRVRGVALLARHPLRAADAAQLGAALLVADPDPSSLAMVVLDQRLANAAEREGLRVLTWPS